ncbi:MAG: DUF4382 domain-containing protein [Cyanophyceae cyanobacterium]
MKQRLLLAGLGVLAAHLLIGCTPEAADEAAEPSSSTTETQAAGEGTLALVANGEDFVRQGFVTKDGWQIDFENVYITLDDATAYQTEPPFDPDSSEELSATNEVTFIEEPQTVDLAAGDEDADPVEVATQTAPTGTYNALAWKVTEATEGPAAGHTIVLNGTATKDGQTVNFAMNLDQPLEYTCGQFVGDERKGILSDEAELEATFHFDHLFGDGEAPTDDPINQGAVGFEPFVALAQDGTLEVDQATLEAELPAEDYQKLQAALNGLGHVGEGHCRLEGEVVEHSHE